MFAPAALLAIVILLALAGFQLALAAGAPLGHFAWGGQHRMLPISLRISSLIAILVYALILSLLLQKANFTNIWPASWIDTGLWIITCYLTVGIGLNAMSRNRAERLMMTPVAAILAILLFIVSLS